MSLDPLLLQFYLEWAGAKLVALPGSYIGPAGPKALWPEYSQDRHEVLQFRNGLPLRANAPGKDEIPLMDLILLWPNLATSLLRRRVLHIRLLVHPVRGCNLYSWSRLAKKLKTGPAQVKLIHSRALVEVARKVPDEEVCLVSSALGLGIPFSRKIA